MPTTGLVWLRRDLRLADNPALAHALNVCERVVPVFIDAPDEEAPWSPGAASRWWLHHSLARLAANLHALGSGLILRQGPTLSTLAELIDACGATHLFWNRLYEPAALARDQNIERWACERGLTVASFNASLLHEPWTLHTGKGTPYKVFTPYWNACLKQPSPSLPEPAAARLPALPPSLHSLPLAALGLLPQIAWNSGLHASWAPGEAGANAALHDFVAEPMLQYRSARDIPADPGTSRLSAHLHFGELGPRQIWHACLTSKAGAEAYLRQLYWREFAHHLLYHFPHSADSPLDARFASFAWLNDEPSLAAWRGGRTGIPIVDAGMRQLRHTGWMHNRVRMVVASLLTKNLLQPWQAGARWFWDTLLDADLANNTLGWQWVAGCGADAAPFFRIFNPILQGERYDADGIYVRRWVPELARLPARWIHRPFEAPPDVLNAAAVRLGRDYPWPIVDLKGSRQRALAAWGDIKGAAS